jgi:hypothetical protein
MSKCSVPDIPSNHCNGTSLSLYSIFVDLALSDWRRPCNTWRATRSRRYVPSCPGYDAYRFEVIGIELLSKACERQPECCTIDGYIRRLRIGSSRPFVFSTVIFIYCPTRRRVCKMLLEVLWNYQSQKEAVIILRHHLP